MENSLTDQEKDTAECRCTTPVMHDLQLMRKPRSASGRVAVRPPSLRMIQHGRRAYNVQVVLEEMDVESDPESGSEEHLRVEERARLHAACAQEMRYLLVRLSHNRPPPSLFALMAMSRW